MEDASGEPTRCGIVLAAGEGKRLQSLVRQLRGDTLPKQYVSFIGRRSMLEHTFDRVEKLLPRHRIFTVVSENHLAYPSVVRQLADRTPSSLIVQPENKDTAPGVLLPLVHLYKQYPDSTVAVFPSDHFVFEEDRFMNHVSIAFQAVEQNPSLLVLLGLEPSEAEAEYGYILPNGAAVERSTGLTIRRVCRFVEKPDAYGARELIARGGLWNTMVMVFKVQTLLDMVRAMNPELSSAFQTISDAIGTQSEAERVREVYQRLSPANFSKEILERLPLFYPSCLSVLSVAGVLWSDWGLPRSIERVFRRLAPKNRLARVGGSPENRLQKIFSERLHLENQIPAKRKTIRESRKRAIGLENFKLTPLASPSR